MGQPGACREGGWHLGWAGESMGWAWKGHEGEGDELQGGQKELLGSGQPKAWAHSP